MKIIKVNNFVNYLIFRIFISLIICVGTYYVTGRIADSEELLSRSEYDIYNPVGGRTIVAKSFYLIFSNINNVFIIIVLLTLISSILIYFLLRKYIDTFNKDYWFLLLLSPGILLYANTPTKETIAFYPAIAAIILECNSLIQWRKWNTTRKIINLISKIINLYLIYILRGNLVLIYFIVPTLILLVSNLYIKPIRYQINTSKAILTAFIISNVLIFISNSLYPTWCENILNYPISSFGTNSSSLSRNYINYEFIVNPINSIRMIYLGLFPSINEVISKPYSVIIILESALYIFLYHKIWSILFKLINNDFKLKTLLYFCFISITICYFLIFNILSTLNIGSGQRLKVNFIPIGIIFPLILEKKIRSLKTLI